MQHGSHSLHLKNNVTRAVRSRATWERPLPARGGLLGSRAARFQQNSLKLLSRSGKPFSSASPSMKTRVDCDFCHHNNSVFEELFYYNQTS